MTSLYALHVTLGTSVSMAELMCQWAPTPEDRAKCETLLERYRTHLILVESELKRLPVEKRNALWAEYVWGTPVHEQ